MFSYQIPLFSSIGSIDSRIYLFGGKDKKTRKLTAQTYEIVPSLLKNGKNLQEQGFEMTRRCNLSQPKGRVALAKVEPISAILVIGGSARFNEVSDMATDQCELYSTTMNTFYHFPCLNESRENASVCNFQSQDGTHWVYVFGGFDEKKKGGLESVERI